MRFGPLMIFAAAAACAGAAAILVRSAVNTPGNETPVMVTAPAKRTKSVLVATQDLKPGDKLQASAVRETEWPEELLPKGAFTSRAALFAAGAEPTLSAAVAENEPIMAQRVLNGADNGLTGYLSKGMGAITIRVNETSGVGGFAQPGDRVDILMTQTERLPETAPNSPRTYTKTLVKNVRILAADQQTERKQQMLAPKTVTLEASSEDCKKLTLASTIAQLSLTLTKGDRDQTEDRLIDSHEIGAPNEQRDEQVTAALAPVVSVFRLVERKEYRVPEE